MTTITSLDQIKSISERVYVRWSRSIVKDQRRGYSTRYGSQRESGLSVCEIDKTWSDWRILRQLSEYQFVGGSCWIVTGDEIGKGGDNEPLLTNLILIGKVSSALLAQDWLRMQKDDEISRLQDSLTRITDPIGRRIIESDLAALLDK